MNLFVVLGKQADACECRGWRLEGIFSSFDGVWGAVSTLKAEKPLEYSQNPDYWTVEPIFVAGTPKHVFAVVSDQSDETRCDSNELHGLYRIWWEAEKMRQSMTSADSWYSDRHFSINKFVIDEVARQEYWS